MKMYKLIISVFMLLIPLISAADQTPAEQGAAAPEGASPLDEMIKEKALEQSGVREPQEPAPEPATPAPEPVPAPAAAPAALQAQTSAGGISADQARKLQEEISNLKLQMGVLKELVKKERNTGSSSSLTPAQITMLRGTGSSLRRYSRIYYTGYVVAIAGNLLLYTATDQETALLGMGISLIGSIISAFGPINVGQAGMVLENISLEMQWNQEAPSAGLALDF